MPTRDENQLIADLDALIEESVSFKLHGHYHEIRGISTIEFLKFSEKLAKLNLLRDDTKKITGQELIHSYYEVINSICSTITYEDIEKCTYAQIGALFQIIIDKTTGRLTDDKKKSLINQQIAQQEK